MVGRTEKWITALMDGLNQNVDEKTLAVILEQCGGQCQSQRFVKKARDIYQKSRSTDEFLKRLEQTYKHLHREGGKVYIVYPKCYCSQVNKIPRGNSPEHTATVPVDGQKRCLKGPWEGPLKSSWKNQLSTATISANSE